MKHYRISAALLSAALLISLFSGCRRTQTPPETGSQPAVSQPGPEDGSTRPGGAEDEYLPNVMFLSGPTGVGAAKLMADSEEADSPCLGSVTIAAANDEVTVALNSGEADIAAVATNMAANLYNKTDGKITMLAVNTLGVLYILEKGDSVQRMADLRGRTLYAPSNARGANPEFILRHLLLQNGVDPSEVEIEWRTPQEITTAMVSEESGVCMLPVPAATALLLKDEGVRQALDLSEEWDSVSGTPLAMGCLVARTDFLREHPEAAERFLEQYRASIDYMRDPENLKEAAQLAARYEITASAAIAEAAIPQCNLAFITGEEMRDTIQNYYTVLMAADPGSIGGSLPYDDFYHIP